MACCRRFSTWRTATATTRPRWERVGRASRAWRPGCTAKAWRRWSPMPGPILDALSTEAEATLYAEIAAGQTTRYAVRRAREAMIRAADPAHSVYREGAAEAVAQAVRETHPFAWSQLVLYHRGADHPLSPPAPSGTCPPRIGRAPANVPGCRHPADPDHRLHRPPHRAAPSPPQAQSRPARVRAPGPGGPGQVDPGPAHGARPAPRRRRPLYSLVPGRREACRRHCPGPRRAALGVWPQAVRLGLGRGCFAGGSDRRGPSRAVWILPRALLQSVKRLVVYLDNLESLLNGPGDDGDGPPDPDAFGQWQTPALGAIWSVLNQFAEDGDKLHVVASCRYRHDDFRQGLVPVPPLPADALFRLMGWFKGLRRLSTTARARLVGRLAGHPRAVEYADDLIQKALVDWEDKRGPWRLAESPSAADLDREWTELIEPALPRVQTKLWDNLLLAELWDRVVDDRARRMLFRMTLLRRPWQWDLVGELGEEGESASQTTDTAERLRRTSLLEQMDVLRKTGQVRHFTIHPATAQFVSRRFAADPALRQAAHRRVGTCYEALAQRSPYLEDYIEAGHHLFQAGEFDRSL